MCVLICVSWLYTDSSIMSGVINLPKSSHSNSMIVWDNTHLRNGQRQCYIIPKCSPSFRSRQQFTISVQSHVLSMVTSIGKSTEVYTLHEMTGTYWTGHSHFNQAWLVPRMTRRSLSFTGPKVEGSEGIHLLTRTPWLDYRWSEGWLLYYYIWEESSVIYLIAHTPWTLGKRVNT